MKVIHIRNNNLGYEIVKLIANSVSRKNKHKVIEKNGNAYFTKGFILANTESIKKILDSLEKTEQYNFVKTFREEPFVSMYLNNN